MNKNPRDKLRDFIQQHCLIKDFSGTLSTGVASSFYFDCKKAALDGECLNWIAEEFLTTINQLPEKANAVGGLTMGADFIVAGIISHAHAIGHSIKKGAIVRKEPKKHGTKNRIENELPKGTRIVVVDDVITSGGSIRQACREFREYGYQIVGIIALVDRQAGGQESLEREFDNVISIFNLKDFSMTSTNTDDEKTAFA